MNEKGKSRFKKKRVYFTQVSNHALRDKKLSMKAKGLYSLIQSYITIEGFTLYKATLRKDSKEGRHAFESAWRELKSRGYLVQEQHNAGDGTFYYLYELLDKPYHRQETCTMVNLPHGKPGRYSNTDSSNTDLNNIKSNNDKGQNLRPDYPLKEYAKDIVREYVYTYKEILGKDHPRLRREQLERVIDVIVDFERDAFWQPVDWSAMIERHFERCMDTDYNINHFATPGVLENIRYEIGFKV